MSEASEREERPERAGMGVATAEAVGGDAAPDRDGTGGSGTGAAPYRPEGGEGGGGDSGRHWWGGRKHDADADRPPTGVAASMITSGGLLLAMVEDLRMRGGDTPEDVRPLADTFARHCAAKEATVRKVLERHGESVGLVARDRQEGDLIQGILDRALTGRHPEETRRLTIDGALAQMYQYLSHERRDLVPALVRAVPDEESETLSAAFEAINAPH